MMKYKYVLIKSVCPDGLRPNFKTDLTPDKTVTWEKDPCKQA